MLIMSYDSCQLKPEVFPAAIECTNIGTAIETAPTLKAAGRNFLEFGCKGKRKIMYKKGPRQACYSKVFIKKELTKSVNSRGFNFFHVIKKTFVNLSPNF